MTVIRISSSKLDEYKKNPQLLEDDFYAEEGDAFENELDLDKSWDGIDFLLAGSKNNTNRRWNPLAKLIYGTQFIDEEQDLGYGPAQYLRPEQVIEISKMLSIINSSQLRKKFNAEQMKKEDIYPEIWDEQETALEYLESFFDDLKNFYAEAARENQATISVIS